MATKHVPAIDNLDSLKAQVQSIPAEDEKRAFHTVLKQLEAVLQTIENKDKLDSGEKVAAQDVGHLKGLIKDIAKNEGVETTFNHSNEKDQQLEGNYHTLTRLIEEGLELNPNSKMEEAYQYADFVIVATPTDYDSDTNKFDTASVDSVVEAALNANPSSLVVIKSTIPVGHTQSLQKQHDTKRVIFSPEFLREGSALYDNLYPSRIVVGGQCEHSRMFANL